MIVLHAPEELRQSIRVADGQRVQNVRLVADSPDVEKEPIAGRVIDKDGEPVAGAQVTTNGGGFMGRGGPSGANISASTMTSDDGRFELEDIPPDTQISLSARGMGYGRSEPTVVPSGSRNVVITLERLGAAEGRVFDGETGEAIPFFEFGNAPAIGPAPEISDDTASPAIPTAYFTWRTYPRVPRPYSRGRRVMRRAAYWCMWRKASLRRRWSWGFRGPALSKASC